MVSLLLYFFREDWVAGGFKGFGGFGFGGFNGFAVLGSSSAFETLVTFDRTEYLGLDFDVTLGAGFGFFWLPGHD